MGKSLVIVESPAKAKKINQYLGSNYVVKSSVGIFVIYRKVVVMKKRKKRNRFQPKG